MHTECYPISMLPHSSRLFLDFAERREPLLPFFPFSAYSNGWMLHASAMSPVARRRLVAILERQNRAFNASGQVFANINRLGAGANAVVTGQQVTLFGGPLYTLLKAATVIRKAHDATAAGYPHVPIFWLATEDHDLAEANQVVLPSRHELHRLSVDLPEDGRVPVGNIHLPDDITRVVQQAAGLLDAGTVFDALEAAYRPGVTVAQSFAAFLAHVFARHGLILIDASTPESHALGAEVLRQAIVRAEELHAALEERNKLLIASGYHAQVLVTPNSSLLFLEDAETRARMPLKRSPGGDWHAAKRVYHDHELLEILKAQPERISPNALLRPVFQDSILPTSAYIAGPAEIAYFAQTQVLYQRILGHTTTALPRLSATLVDPSIAEVMSRHEVTLPDLLSNQPDELVQKLGARAMPFEGKRKLAAAGNALDEELSGLTTYMRSLDPALGRSAEVAASKMRYQMNRLRRLAANYQLQRDASLRRHSDALYLSLYPERHLQERLIGAAYFLSRYGEGLVDLLVQNAAQECPGHRAIYL